MAQSFVIESFDGRLMFARADVAEAHGIVERFVRADEIPADPWTSLSVVVEGDEWHLTNDRLTLGELMRFSVDPEYLRNVDDAIPVGRRSPYIVGWDHNNSAIGEPFTLQTVMYAYKSIVRNAIREQVYG